MTRGGAMVVVAVIAVVAAVASKGSLNSWAIYARPASCLVASIVSGSSWFVLQVEEGMMEAYIVWSNLKSDKS
jgi:hypothetical protein